MVFLGKSGEALEGLHTLDNRIITQGIHEMRPAVTVTTGSTAKRIGQFITGTEREYLEVVVSFSIKERKDLAARARIIDAVNAWAMAGEWMSVNYRPDKRLRVFCYQPVETGFVRDWTENLSLSFRTLGVPYWLNASAPEVLTSVAANTTQQAQITPGGTEYAPLEGIVMNMDSGTINAVSMSYAGQTLAFQNLGLAAGEVLRLSVDERGILQLYISEKSSITNDRTAQDKRTPASVDEIILPPGGGAVSCAADGQSIFLLRSRGRWA